MIAFFKRQKFIFIIFFSTLLIVGGMLLLNDVAISIRLLELKVFLQDINRESSKIDQLGMISKYVLQMKLYENEINETKLDEEELNTANLIENYSNQDELSVSKYKYLSQPIRVIINLLRFLLDKPPIQSSFENPVNNELSLAYYFERNKYYKKALEVYEDLIRRKQINEDQIPNILLHQGFCLALLNDYDGARNKYAEIIHDYKNQDISIIALSLLEYLEDIESEIVKIKASDRSDLEKSEKLYQLIAYNEAMELLENFPEPEDAETATKIKYLKARCFEETGAKEESTRIYQEIITSDHTSESAKLANRRILIISAIDHADDNAENLNELSKKNNVLIGDETFDKLVAETDAIKSDPETNLRLKSFLQATPEPGEDESTITAALSKQPESTNSLEAETPEESVPQEASFDTFIRESLQLIEQKIDTAAELVTPTPPTPQPTAFVTTAPTRTRVIRNTKKPTPKATPKATPSATLSVIATPTPGPYDKKYLDSEGRLEKLEKYDQKHNLLKTYIYQWNEQGDLPTVKVYDSDGRLIEEEFSNNGDPD